MMTVPQALTASGAEVFNKADPCSCLLSLLQLNSLCNLRILKLESPRALKHPSSQTNSSRHVKSLFHRTSNLVCTSSNGSQPRLFHLHAKYRVFPLNLLTLFQMPTLLQTNQATPIRCLRSQSFTLLCLDFHSKWWRTPPSIQEAQ